MVRSFAVIAAIVALTSAAATMEYHAVRAAPLASALLTEDDLPAGWTVAGPLDADAGLPFSCPLLPDPMTPLQRMGVLLSGDAAGATAYQTVSLYRPGEAEQLLAAATSEGGPCEWTQPLDDGSDATMMELPPAPLSLGDSGAQRGLVMQGDGFTLDGEIVIVRCGDMITQLTEFSVGQDAQLHYDAVVRRLAEAAVRRLGLAGQECQHQLWLGAAHRPV